MRLKIHHTTVYHYPRAVMNSVNEVWLRPLSDRRQACPSFKLTTDPATSPRPYTDYFGNTVYHFDVAVPHVRLAITADAEVVTADGDGADALDADQTAYRPLDAEASDRWLDFLTETPLTSAGAGVRGLAREIAEAGGATSGVLRAVAAHAEAALRYEGGVTGVETSAEAALATGVGVCQDYTHLFLSICRSLGIPARYVSGYLCTDAGEDQDQASHAWPEALLPLGGWVGFDPTNGRLVDGRYVRVAIGRDYSDVPPVRGAYSGLSGQGLEVAVYVLSEQQQQQRSTLR